MDRQQPSRAGYRWWVRATVDDRWRQVTRSAHGRHARVDTNGNQLRRSLGPTSQEAPPPDYIPLAEHVDPPGQDSRARERQPDLNRPRHVDQPRQDNRAGERQTDRYRPRSRSPRAREAGYYRPQSSRDNPSQDRRSSRSGDGPRDRPQSRNWNQRSRREEIKPAIEGQKKRPAKQGAPGNLTASRPDNSNHQSSTQGIQSEFTSFTTEKRKSERKLREADSITPPEKPTSSEPSANRGQSKEVDTPATVLMNTSLESALTPP